MDCPHLAFSTWCGTAWVSVPAAVGFQRSTQLWHCGTGWAGYATPLPIWGAGKTKQRDDELKANISVQAFRAEQAFSHLVLFQELQLDGDVVSHPLVLLAVDLELLLGLLDLGHGGGVTWPQIQFLQICTVRVILNPGSMSLFEQNQNMFYVSEFTHNNECMTKITRPHYIQCYI